jgi:hypothetical protein
MDRTIALLAMTAALPGCPYDPAIADPTEITTHGSDTSAGTASEEGPTDPTTEPTDPSAPSTSNPSDPDAGTDTTAAVCGDGDVSGDEVCDDTVNDGAYGGCLADCSDFAGRCGDEAINGPEVCDDGLNDGSYGGCVDGCSALGPHCGDTEINGPEACDNGDGNVNGSGCNLDCVISGSLVGTYDLGGLTFCDGVYVTRPAFRDNGTTVVAATGYCDTDTSALVELAADASESQMFDLLLPGTPVREATTVGDDWVLAASNCNYVISATGELTEICEERTTGYQGIEGADDGSYVALYNNALALYPAGSPMAGDSPTWLVNATNDANYAYYFYATTFGASGSVAVAGSYTYVPNGTSYGYVARYTAAGNLAADYTNSEITAFEGIVHAPDGTVLALGGYPTYNAVRLDATYSNGTPIVTGADSNLAAAFDSTSALVMLYHEADDQSYHLTKRASDGTALWNQVITSVNYSFRLAVDPNDGIWVADAAYADDGTHLVVQKFAP